MHTKLRVGVLVNSETVPNWAFQMLERIQAGDYARIVLIVRNGATEARPPLLQRLWANRHTLLARLLLKLDERLGRGHPDATEPRKLAPLAPEAPWVTVRPVRTRFYDSLTDEDLRRIKAYDVDVFVRLGFRVIRGEFLQCARHGIWSYHHGDNRVNRGGPAGFWEVMEGWPETGAVLQVLSEDLDAGLVLARTWSQTHHLLVARNHNNIHWHASMLLPRQLRQLALLGPERFGRLAAEHNAHPTFYSRRLYAMPGNGTALRLIARHYSAFLWRKLRSLLYFDQWILLCAANPQGDVCTSLRRFRPIHSLPPKDRFWADPFVVCEKGRHYVFFEDCDRRTRKAHISYLSLDQHDSHGEPRKALERPYHLSYPFIFSHRGAYYMIPETAANRTIELYGCVNFPDRWELVKVLKKDVLAVDTTLFYQGGLWWLFTCMREVPEATHYDELFLFYAQDPVSDDWVAHPQNPIVSDGRCARPAGALFTRNGNTYRPSQNSGKVYGRSTRIQQVLQLSEREYQEVCVGEIEPLWDRSVSRTHTLNHAGAVTVVDALISRSRLPWAAHGARRVRPDLGTLSQARNAAVSQTPLVSSNTANAGR